MDIFRKKIKTFFDNPNYYGKVANLPVDPLQFTKARKYEFEKLLHFLGPYKGLHFIELGSGYGKYVLPLLYIGAKVTAVDIAENALRACYMQAKKNNIEKNLTIAINNFQSPVYHNKYDGALCISTFHLLGEKKEERRNILANLIKSVKPGGVIILIEPNPLNPFFYPLYLLFPQVSWELEKHFTQSTKENLENILHDLKLKRIQVEYVGFFPLRFINNFSKIGYINNLINNTPLIKKLSSFIYIKGYK